MKTLIAIISLLCFAPTPNNSHKTSLKRILPQGTTIVYEPIILKSGESLFGHPNGSTLQLSNGAECPVIIIGDKNPDPKFSVERVHVSSFKIKGNKRNQKWEGFGGDPNIKAHSIRNSGIVVRFAREVVIDNVDVSDCRSGGIVTERGCSNIYIVNSKLHGNFFDGAAFYETCDSYLSGCELFSNGYAGVSIDLGVNRMTFTNLSITENGREAIFARNCYSNMFNRIFLYGNGGYGIFLAKSELPNSEVVGNVFSNFVFSGVSGGYVKVNDPECSQNFLVNPSYIGEKFVGLDK